LSTSAVTDVPVVLIWLNVAKGKNRVGNPTRFTLGQVMDLKRRIRPIARESQRVRIDVGTCAFAANGHSATERIQVLVDEQHQGTTGLQNVVRQLRRTGQADKLTVVEVHGPNLPHFVAAAHAVRRFHSPKHAGENKAIAHGLP
jgi:hypothetical protein